ncbi:shikimate dehydrogenase [Alteromonas pelagimontana]|uniref:Shikimate dehydrogenase (NADP(+)) n=1 Tax=Alteromonas pelagimontana TaxID=1858656 RepID=A0A6M4MCU4_9ALTE|nr:shikimate dehydrogenase [Alteromonas pelagimontana]QJR81004.1 shikimate dehydrogenase [Alteromonas pelagimontana]
MKKFAVFGNPVAHSVSPTIHQMFARSCGEDIDYIKIEAPLDGFAKAIADFFEDKDAVGCNVTVPFKQQAYALATQLNQEARAAQAVNTLYKHPEGKLHGYNTDGIGLVADLLAHGAQLKGQKVLLIGAGGAARGVIHPLLAAGVSTLVITNRTQERAQEIVDSFQQEQLVSLTNQKLDKFTPDIIINSTSASLNQQLPSIQNVKFEQCQIAYDMVYGKAPTIFMEHAKQQGSSLALDGLGMLVEQAAAAFTIWTEKKPETRPVVTALREAL